MSAISWTDYAFTSHTGCTKVSRGCDNCYAEAYEVTRFRRVEWGPHGKRLPRPESAWKEPPRWQRKAAREATRKFVFCSHRSDVFDIRAPVDARDRLWQTIRDTLNLTWLLLTKRPQNFGRFLPPDWGDGYANVWLGVSSEGQREAKLRLPLLCRTPAVRRFVSAEPLLEPVDLGPWLGPVSWVIGGCESSPGKRPTDLSWLRDLRDQCAAAGTAFWLKQAVIDGKLVELPALDGQIWAQRPAP